MNIKERETDMAGNYRYLVEVDSTLAIPLKYVTSVTDEKVLQDAQAVYDRMIEQEEKNSWITLDFSL
jgi:hypothetical protein